MSSGGMATVHFGRLVGPVGFSRVVAVKRLHPHFAKDPAFVSMFVDEARLVSRIKHPNVVPTLDVVSTDQELFLVMEYVHGESLSRLLTAIRTAKIKMSPHIVSAVMSGVLRGLHAAHEATHPKTGPLNIVHRDVSPQNVLVGVDGLPRVLDFGVAKALDRVQEHTRDGQLKGKLAYMAPEQFRSSAVTRSVDIFAAAIVLWEALTGRRLYYSEKQPDVVRKILESAPAPPSQIMIDPAAPPPSADVRQMLNAVDEVVLKGLAKDPAKRYATAREMAEALERAAPPAAPSELTEFVEHFAAASLAERSKQMAQLGSLGQTLVAPMAFAQIASTVEAAQADAVRSSLSSRPSIDAIPPPPRPATLSSPGLVPAPRPSSSGTSVKTARKPPDTLPKALVAFIALTIAIILGSAGLISYTLMHRR